MLIDQRNGRDEDATLETLHTNALRTPEVFSSPPISPAAHTDPVAESLNTSVAADPITRVSDHRYRLHLAKLTFVRSKSYKEECLFKTRLASYLPRTRDFRLVQHKDTPVHNQEEAQSRLWTKKL